MPDTRPRMVLNDGICNACSYHNTKGEISYEQRREQFLSLVRDADVHPAYDCVVPFSGGKDSASIAYRLKFDLGLNPLLVCYGQLIWTDVGQYNYNQVAKAGFDIVYWRTNQDVSRKLAKRFLIERGHPKAAYDAAINAVPIITAKQMGIPLVIYAEHGDTEYGGLVLSEKSRRERDLEEVLEHCVGDDARNWVMDGISERDLFPYIYPDDVTGIKAIYFSYYFGWDIHANAVLACDKMGFKQAGWNRTPQDALWDWGRSDGSFEGFDSVDDAIDGLDFHLMYRKFGFGRSTRMAGRLINYGYMSREQALGYIEAFDHEYPEMYLPEVLEYLDMDRKQLDAILEQHDEHLNG